MKKFVINLLLYIPRIIIFLPLFFVYSISSSPIANKAHKDLLINTPPFLSTETQWVDLLLNQMTLDEKIGQLFMIPAYSNRDFEHAKKVAELIKKYHVGGIIFFQGSPVRQAKLTNYFQAKSKIPLMIAGDYEWGLSMRLDSTVRYPRQMLMGAIQDDKLIYEFGKETGRQLKRMGIHINFAPVIDINNNPDNPVINSRSFGEQPENVARKGLMYMLGMQDTHVLATAKHFPGHGDTDTDSHKDLPVILHSKKRLDSIETYPFKVLSQNGLGAVMVAHLNIPALDASTNSVSGLSKPIVTKYLKQEIGFKGLTFTDALGMQGVAKHNKPGETELKAFKAGVDILLMPRNLPIAFETIKKALQNGTISENELNEKVKKILKAKKWFGLDKYTPVKIKNLITDLNSGNATLINRKLTEASITVASDNYGVIPFTLPKGKRIASLSIGNGKINNFQNRLSVYEKVDKFALFKNVSEAEFKKYKNKLKHYDFVIISLHNTNRRPPLFGINKNSLTLIEDLAHETNVILTVFGNPYILKHLKVPQKQAAVIVSYNDRKLTRDLTAQLIFGGIKAKGHLPVSSGNYFKAGFGETNEKIRLKYSIPEELDIKIKKLEQIDSVTLKAINDKAMPGAVIIGAKNGVVFYRKAFGTHSYRKEQKTQINDLFDLASLTKILATVPALMKLSGEAKFNPYKTIGEYLTEAQNTNKSDLRLIDVLSHRARLRAWIPFYLHTYNKEKTAFKKGIYSSKKTTEYPYIVARNMYINRNYEDTLYREIYNSKLRKKKEYLYSDLGYYLMKKIIESLSQKSLKEYTAENFYQPIGAYSMGYNPLERFPAKQIVPTEIDTKFRHQELRGYVHDYGAAMTGGINGHAGLFANADDISKMLQMFLQKGSYGNHRYLRPEVIAFYTKQHFNPKKNRRALGFDKPKRPKGGPTAQVVSDKSYGHSGFTGTYVWVDPEYNFIYVFLSNSIHPSIENKRLLRHNVRTKIQQLFYEAFMTKEQLDFQKKAGTLTEFI